MMIPLEWTDPRRWMPEPYVDVLGYFSGVIRITHISENGDWHDGDPDLWLPLPSPPRIIDLRPGEHAIRLYRVDK